MDLKKALNLRLVSLYEKEDRNLQHRDTRRRPHEGGGRDWVDVPEAKECQGLPGSHQKLREELGTHCPPETPKAANAGNTLVSEYWLPEP